MNPAACDFDDLARVTSAVEAADEAIASLIQHRTRLERVRQSLEMEAGGTRFTQQREVELFHRFRCLGVDGASVATALVLMARSPDHPLKRHTKRIRADEPKHSLGDAHS
ncbi:MAG: hypothetical protein AUG44_16055 [Actinobacteria bacterium 13_1_20CM_3_71_11]|nr:MAG: hypothetical protein AUG44_16055 [Actinobacteria bacterium 13_1_20CM_3_71_11]